MKLRYKGHHDLIGSTVLAPGRIYEPDSVIFVNADGKQDDYTGVGIRFKENEIMRRWSKRAFEMLFEKVK